MSLIGEQGKVGIIGYMKGASIFYRFLAGVAILIALFFIFKMYFAFQGNLKVSVALAFSAAQENAFVGGFWDFLTRASNWFFDLFHFNQIRFQAKNLQAENIDLLFRLTQFKKFEQENIALRGAFNLQKQEGYHLVPAQVILMDPAGFSGQFWLDRGRTSGLKPGMNIVLSNRVLVGVLKECFENYCRGESIFLPQTKIGVESLESRILAILEKDTQGRYLLKLVPQEADIAIGDLLVTSHENTHFLKGLLVAKIKDIIPSFSVLKEYITEPLFSANQLSEVFIITDFIPQDASTD